MERIRNKVNVNPRDPLAHRQMGGHYLREGAYDRALGEFRLAMVFDAHHFNDILIDFEKALDADPVNIRLRLTLADFYLGQGCAAEATLELEEILEFNPGNRLIYNLLGTLYLKTGHLEDAIRLLEKARGLGVKDTALVEQLAEAYLKQGRWQEAAAFYEEVVSREGKSKKVLRILGELYTRINDFEAAARAYTAMREKDASVAEEICFRLEELAALSPDSAALRLSLAEAYTAYLKPDRAAEEYRRALQLAPDRRAAVGQSLRKILEVYPDQPDTLLVLAEVLTLEGDFSEATELFSRLLRLNPALSPAVIEGYQKIIARYPEQAMAHEALAEAFFLTGDWRAALSEYRTLLKLNSGAAEAVLRRVKEISRENVPAALLAQTAGEAYFARGDFRRAADEAARAIEADNRAVENYQLLARARFAAGDWEGTAKAYSAAIKLEPYHRALFRQIEETVRAKLDQDQKALEARLEKDPRLNQELARVHFLKGDLEEALKALAEMKDPSYLTAEFIGRVSKEQGNFTRAIAQFQKAWGDLPSEASSEIRFRIKYQLASTLEAVGEVKEALSLYQELVTESADYAGLEGRIKLIKECNPRGSRNPSAAMVVTGRWRLPFFGLDTRPVGAGRRDELLNISFGQDHNQLGFAYLAQGLRRQAEEEFLVAVQLDPTLAAAANNLGAVYLLMERDESAAEKFSSAISLEPDFAVFRHNLGVCQYLNGNLREAEDNLSRALTLDPTLGPAAIMLGDLFCRREEIDYAVPLWERFTVPNPVADLAERRLTFRKMLTPDEFGV